LAIGAARAAGPGSAAPGVAFAAGAAGVDPALAAGETAAGAAGSAGVGVAVACFALLVSGTIATAAGPHSGGKDVYRLWRLHPALLLHGAAVAVLGCSLMFLIGYLLARRSAIGGRYAAGVVGLAGLVLVQMALGDIQYRTHLPWGLVLVHVAVAATVWAWTVALVTLMWRPVSRLR